MNAPELSGKHSPDEGTTLGVATYDLRPTTYDLRPTTYEKHLQCDVLTILDRDWDLFVVHPDCRFLCSSGLHWNGRKPGRAEETEKALQFVEKLFANKIKKFALENPTGCISTRIMKYDQRIQPYEFGEDASKGTCLWLRGLPKLKLTKRFPGRLVEYPKGSGKIVERWSNQTDSGQNRLGPSDDRWLLRATTYKGIADAMAEQWGSLP